MSQYDILDVGGTPNPAYHSTWTYTVDAERIHIGSGSTVASKTLSLTPPGSTGPWPRKTLFFQIISPAVPISTYFVHHGLFRAVRASGPTVAPGHPASGIDDVPFPMQAMRTSRVVDASGVLHASRGNLGLQTGTPPLGAISFPTQTISGPNNEVSVQNGYILTTEQSFHLGDYQAAALGQYPLTDYTSGDKIVIEIGVSLNRWSETPETIPPVWNTDPIDVTISFGSGSFLTFASRTASGKGWLAFSEFESAAAQESFRYSKPYRPTHRPIRFAAAVEVDAPFLNTDSFNE